MAIKKVVEKKDGGSAEYWRVSPYFTFDVVEGRLDASLLLYTNEVGRRAGKRRVEPLSVQGYPMNLVLEGADALAAVQSGDPRPALYGALKALPFFASSEDC